MWLDRFRIRLALPLARGRIRRMVTPSSTNAWDTNRSARRRLSVCSAFDAALAITLYSGSLAACGANCSVLSASGTSMPRTRSTTRRTLVGEIRTWRAIAYEPGRSPSSAARRLGRVSLLISQLSLSVTASARQRRRDFRSSLMWPRKVRVGANSPSL